MRIFPIILQPTSTIERRPNGRRCPHDRWWYADWHNARRGSSRHRAQDVFAPSGSPVVAPDDGTVLGVASEATERGGWWLKLRVGRRTYYMAHLQGRPLVTRGQSVEAGQLIARVGRSGNAATTCPHLHISRKERGQSVNIYDDLRRVDPTLPPRVRRRIRGGYQPARSPNP